MMKVLRGVVIAVLLLLPAVAAHVLISRGTKFTRRLLCARKSA